MGLPEPHAERDGRHAVAVQPRSVQTAADDDGLGFETGALHRRFGPHHGRVVGRQFEGVVGLVDFEVDPAPHTIRTSDREGRALEFAANGGRDVVELGVVEAPRLAGDEQFVLDRVRSHFAEAGDVQVHRGVHASAGAEESLLHEFASGKGEDERSADALLGFHAGVGQLAHDLDPVLVARAGAAVDDVRLLAVEGEDLPCAKQRGVEVAGAHDLHLFGESEDELERRVRQLAVDEGVECREDHGDAGDVVGREDRAAVGGDPVVRDDRPHAAAGLHPVEVGAEAHDRSVLGSRDIDDQVSGAVRRVASRVALAAVVVDDHRIGAEGAHYRYHLAGQGRLVAGLGVDLDQFAEGLQGPLVVDQCRQSSLGHLVPPFPFRDFKI